MDRRPPSKVRQRKGGLTVSAERRSQQRKKRLILTDREKLPVADRPANWGEIKGDPFDLANERVLSLHVDRLNQHTGRAQGHAKNDD
jgi:hypothetical protein